MTLRTRLSRMLLHVLILSLLAALLALLAAAQQKPQLQPEAEFKSMLDAVRSNSFEKFMANADASFKGGFPQQMFDGLARKLGPRLQSGYSATFLTTLKQQGYVVYAWKLSFKDGGDEYLITMFTKDDAVSGFVTR